jgi:hypothetical protein
MVAASKARALIEFVQTSAGAIRVGRKRRAAVMVPRPRAAHTSRRPCKKIATLTMIKAPPRRLRQARFDRIASSIEGENPWL